VCSYRPRTLCHTVLCCTAEALLSNHSVLCCAVLCCAVLCCAVLCCAVLCGTLSCRPSAVWVCWARGSSPSSVAMLLLTSPTHTSACSFGLWRRGRLPPWRSSTGRWDHSTGGSTGRWDHMGQAGRWDHMRQAGRWDHSTGGSTGRWDHSTGGSSSSSTGRWDHSTGGSTGRWDHSTGGSTGRWDHSTGGSTGRWDHRVQQQAMAGVRGLEATAQCTCTRGFVWLSHVVMSGGGLTA